MIIELTEEKSLSYASKVTLEKRLETAKAICPDSVRGMIVKNENDRWTFVFIGQDQIQNWHAMNHRFLIIS